MLSHMILGLSAIALVLAIFITWLIAKQVEKQLSAKIAALVYLLVAFIPLYHLIRMLARQPESWLRPFFYMWFIFALFCVLMAVHKIAKFRSQR